MYKNIIASSVFHLGIILIATMSLPFITKKPIELPPIISVELIQIMDKTNIPYAPKAKKIIEEVKKKEEKKQNPEKVDNEIKQVSEFEKEEMFDPDSIAALIDKSKEDIAETTKKSKLVTQSEDQIFGCWSIPLGLPYNENLLVRIKLKLKPDGTVTKTEILDHARMNMPGQGFFKVLAESALRAIQLCQPLRVPNTGYERWKDMQLNFDAREMLEG